MFGVGLWVWEEGSKELCYSITSIKNACHQPDWSLLVLTLLLTEVVLSDFSPVKLLFPPFLTNIIIFGRKSLVIMCSPHLGMGHLALCPWRRSFYTRYLEYSAREICLFTPVHTCKYGHVDISFTLQAIIQCYFIFLLKLFTLWLFQWAPVCLWHATILRRCIVFENILIFWDFDFV